MEKEIKEFEAQNRLDKLYNLGVINSAGEYIAYHPDEEEKDMNES